MNGSGSAGGGDLRESFVSRTSSFGKAPQLEQLQRLGQPYFLPRGRRSGWHFLWLLAALAFCVIGAGLVLLTAILHLVFALCPDVGRRVFSGARDLVDGLWSGNHGPAIMVLALVGVVSFKYFGNELRGMWSQWFLLGFIVLVLFSINAMNTGIGFVANYLTQAMVDEAPHTYYRWLHIYASCFIVALPVLTMQYYARAKLGILWRNWLTSHLVEGWTSHRAYYILNANDEKAAEEGVDNPDQRIAQDVDTFTNMTLNYLIGTIDSLTSFGMNILVLWHMNATITIVLVSWSIGMTAITLALSKYLVRINYRQLKFEADFRYSLVHVRDNAESIAFYGGEASERFEIRRRLGSLVGNYNELIMWNVVISVVSKMYNYGNVFVPFVVMGPLVLSGELKFGDFNQATFAFRMVEGALAFIANSIGDMTAWIAGIKRLEGFQTAVEQVEGTTTDRVTRKGAKLVVRNAELRAPGSGQLLISGLTLSLSRGERLLVVGPSGCGKTSLLRMICGLWQPTDGALEETPRAGQLFFVPQKPYMILGSLREQLSYPRGQNEEGAWPFSDEQLRQALRDACLGHFVERYPDLAIKQDWARLLSLGEQQRVSFARVLLNEPGFVVLDEATSGLDVATEGRLYGLLVQRGTALMSVGHRPALKDFHDSVLALEGAPTGGWRLLPAASYQMDAVAER